MTGDPRAYDREFTVATSCRARRRLGFDTERGEVVRFVVQLEYLHDGEWSPVVRYDHDGTADSQFGHDVTEEGLHIDIFRDEGGDRVRRSATTGCCSPRPRRRAFSEESPTISRQVRTMARDQRPMNAEEIAAMREAMEEQRVTVREALAEDLGGDPEDYRADDSVADGGE